MICTALVMMPKHAGLQNENPQILLRKGGIREASFPTPAEEFFLIPNTFHTDAQVLKASAQERYREVISELQSGIMAQGGDSQANNC